MKNILLCLNGDTEFTRIDENLLTKRYKVTKYFPNSRYKPQTKKLRRLVQNTDAIVCWFASWHGILPLLFAKFFEKKFILIAGGYDTAKISEAQYGNQLRWLSRVITNWIIRNADIVIGNSEFTRREIHEVSGRSMDKIYRIYHGLDFSQELISNKEQIVLNVGNIFRENIKRKGIGMFLETGRKSPEYEFVHIGAWKDADSVELLQRDLAENCSLLGYVDTQVLQSYYSRALFYVQPSLHEGFGLSVLEAMSYGCIPIVSNKGALPEVVGDVGIIMEDISADKISEALKKFDIHDLERLQMDCYHRARAVFTLESRADALYELIEAQK